MMKPSKRLNGGGKACEALVEQAVLSALLGQAEAVS